MPDRASSPLLERLATLARNGPAVVAHRGDSVRHPENTLPAFAAAAALGAPVQEFDVQPCGDGVLVCLHDETLDRTTDAARALGPGALVAQLPLARLQSLDAGAWKGGEHAGARVPTLAEALQCMLPASVPMIERKAGEAATFVRELRDQGRAAEVLLQAFDWEFVAAARRLAAELAVGVLGPTVEFQALDHRALAAARALGASFVHWHAPLVTAAAVTAAHALGLLICTYTSDDDLSWHGGRAIGVDLMCTNDPARMLAALRVSGS